MLISKFLEKYFIYNLFALGRFSHAKKYLLKRLTQNIDTYQTYVLSKDKQRSWCIWAIQQIKYRKQYFSEDLYFWDIRGEKWLANLDHIHGLYEYLNDSFDIFYKCNYNNKTVLDIGGYIGDSARYFLKQGANKVLIYEPVQKNILCMRHNLIEYSTSIEIIPKAVAKTNGTIVIHSNYPPGHIGFGNRMGRYELQVECESFDSILSQVNADIAKVDCEGQEKCLLNVGNNYLTRISYWMIEVHESLMLEKITQKFLSCGFKKLPVVVPEGHQSILHFQLEA